MLAADCVVEAENVLDHGARVGPAPGWGVELLSPLLWFGGAGSRGLSHRTARNAEDREPDGPAEVLTGGLETVLFVCTANVCRSPMAEAIFNVLAKERRFPYWAESAGISDLGAAPMSSDARKVLGEAGISAGDHRARVVTGEMVRESGLVLVMGPRHVTELSRRFGESGKVRLL